MNLWYFGNSEGTALQVLRKESRLLAQNELRYQSAHLRKGIGGFLFMRSEKSVLRSFSRDAIEIAGVCRNDLNN